MSLRELLEQAWSHLDDGDSEAADQVARRVLAESDGGSDERGEALLINAHILVLGGDSEGARLALDAAAPILPSDADCLADAANIALAISNAKLAAGLADRALAIDSSLADAAYSRGLAALALEDNETAVAMFLKTSSCDAADPAPPWAMTLDEFSQVAEETLDELPAVIIEKLENVPIIVEPAPPPELIESGVDPRLFGLFSGVPLTERSALEEGAPTLDAIHIYQRNLERSCQSRDELEEEIRITVIHETAHFFGLEDDDLERLGLG